MSNFFEKSLSKTPPQTSLGSSQTSIGSSQTSIGSSQTSIGLKKSSSSEKIQVDVVSLLGCSQIYEFDSGTLILELIKEIIRTHKSFTDSKKFQSDLVDLQNTKLMYNGRTLDIRKTLEDYDSFQYKSRNPYKMHIITRGGQISESSMSPPNKSPFHGPSSPLHSHLPPGPILNGFSPPSSSGEGLTEPYGFGLHRSSPILIGRSPDQNSFLENQINRINQRQRSISLRQISDSFAEIKENLITNDNFDLSQIGSILASIDNKLSILVDNYETSQSPNNSL
jgi:hypothetical protein